MRPDYPIVPFADAASWRTWLDEYHASSDGVWARLYKKASGVASMTYAEALDEALCYGWIDGQRKSYDELSFLQKFTPRRSKSLWSKRNIEHVKRLTDAGLMTPAGRAEMERAQVDGRWDAAYDAQSTMTIPDSFMTLLAAHPTAMAAFNALKKSERYSIGLRLQTARTQKTLEARQQKIIEELNG